MNRNIVVVAVILFVIVGIFLGSRFLGGTEDGQWVESPLVTGVSENTTGSDASTDRYIEYSETFFNSVSDKRRVLFFYANWCPTCRPADASFSENESQIPEDVVLFRINYNDSNTDDAEKDLAQQYGVTYQHTFVQIDGNGKEITKWNGGQIEELLANLK